MPRVAHPPSTITPRDEGTDALFDQLRQPECDRERLESAIVALNLPLADALAARYFGRGAEADDLIQTARTGLLLAVRRYRPGRGPSFASFAVPTITGELKRHFRDHCWLVRPPRRLQELRVVVRRATIELEQRSGASVTAADLAHSLGLERSQVEECISAARHFSSVPLPPEIPAPVQGGVPARAARPATGAGFSGGGPTEPEFFDSTSPHPGGQAGFCDGLIDRLDVQRAVADLSAADRQLLQWRFVDELSQSEIARLLQVSQMQVSRLLKRTLARARLRLQDVA